MKIIFVCILLPITAVATVSGLRLTGMISPSIGEALIVHKMGEIEPGSVATLTIPVKKSREPASNDQIGGSRLFLRLASAFEQQNSSRWTSGIDGVLRGADVQG